MNSLQNLLSTAGRVFILTLITAAAAFGQLDLTKSEIYLTVPGQELPVRARQVLMEEIAARTGVSLPKITRLPKKPEHLIVLALEENISMLPELFRERYKGLPEIGAEGFKIFAISGANSVVIVGKDTRGLLYGVGRFLRKAEMNKGKIIFPNSEFALATTPKYQLRGHQLGYRPKTNSYDAFTVQQFDQYIRELALFGANSIEILPPRTDDDSISRHMKIPAIEMVKAQSAICKSYGLDVWMWYPNLEKNYSDPETIKKGLAEREAVFKAVPRITSLFAPGGDPGDLEPDELFEWMGKVAQVLRRHHPEAKIWISPQSFRPDKSWFDAFFDHVNRGYPWLGGIVFGPWVKVPIEEIRERVNPSIPIRNYPDITHSLACQYPVPDWDKAWAVTLGREAVNPRPVDQKHFHNTVAPFCIGSLSYSEGTNDDLNKFVWSDQDWDPKMDVTETLMDYSRLFFGSEFAYRGAEALKGLEENSRGSLLAKTTVEQTFRQWKSMERDADSRTMSLARFQMGLIRGYFDQYTRERLIYETALQSRAMEKLENATVENVGKAMTEAIVLLESAWKSPIHPELKRKCEDLADSLFRSIGAQLTIKKHGAMAGRGNFIDNIQFPLNDAPWLLSELNRIRSISGNETKLKEIGMLVNRTDPGPGGFYDHLASPDSRYRIVSNVSWKDDPGSLRSPRTGFGLSLPGNSWYHTIPEIDVKVPLVPANWNNQIEVLYDTPLTIRYDNLEKNAKYRMKVVYTGRFKSHIKLVANGKVLIHDPIKVGEQPVYEFEIPLSVTESGSAEFTWTCGNAERGVQVAEIWLSKTKP